MALCASAIPVIIKTLMELDLLHRDIGQLIMSAAAVDRRQLASLRAVVMNWLAPVFFATAGLRIDLTALAQPVVLAAGAVLLAVAVAIKFGSVYAAGRLRRMSHWEAVAPGHRPGL